MNQLQNASSAVRTSTSPFLKMLVGMLASATFAVGMIGCVGGEVEESDESDEVTEMEDLDEADAEAYTVDPEGGGSVIKVCECTDVYRRCSAPNSYLAKGRTCSWSDGSGSCPGSYPATCGSGPNNTQ